MNNPKSNLTQEVLKENLNYDPNTGIFTRRHSFRVCTAGDVAGFSNGKKNYIRIKLLGDRFLAHRLAWLYVYGTWPENQIDHINCDKTDNRICNLRVVNQFENMQNRISPPLRNTSGYLGVSKHRKKWRAQIRANNVHINIGTFATPEEAHNAYLEAKRRLHPICSL